MNEPMKLTVCLFAMAGEETKMFLIQFGNHPDRALCSAASLTEEEE
mgnify:CR=1 FL=1